MSDPVLLLRLEGPLQSWGSRSRWDVRDTQRIPTKSGVIGLLGCALGYGVGDPRLEQELDAGLLFGVRADAPGRVLEDYHTVSGYLPTAAGAYRHSGVKTASSLEKLRADPDAEPATIVSRRFYLEDASFLVALMETGAVPGLLSRCSEALRRPAWPLYLGRKACPPTRPILEGLRTEYDDLEDALRRHHWSRLGAAGRSRSFGDTRSSLLSAWIETSPANSGAGISVRPEAVRTNAARQYDFVTLRRIHCEAVLPEGGV